jgi:outer membrane protein TolC
LPRAPHTTCDTDLAYAKQQITEIEYPDVTAPCGTSTLDTAPPWTLGGPQPPEFRNLPLEEAVHIALSNSPVMRDVGGLVLRSPQAAVTAINPAIVETDPRFGVEAALSAFDASFAASAFFEKNDRPFNNQIAGLGTQFLQQDLNTYNLELRKRTAAGTSLALRNRNIYDFNNSPFNNIPNLPWTMTLEGEIRQPLLQGAGVDFNRIAGPNSTPGFYNGVMIARINTDVSLADFEAAVVGMVSDVENAYWELYYSYRDLDAKMAARDRAYETWRQVATLVERGPGGQLAVTAEAQAREQLYRLEAEVQDALAGRLPEKTTTTLFRGVGGVYTNERRLRRLMGLPAADGVLLRPAEEPSLARVSFGWEEALAESLTRRVELRRQKWLVKRRELELLASRNYLLPRVDVVSLYRYRGLGQDWFGNQGTEFDSAFGNLTDGDFQEWMMGIEVVNPIGNRQGHAAVRNAQLLVAREHRLLEEQEQEVVTDLSGAISELDRAYLLAMTNYNRRLAALRQLDSLTILLREADNIEKPRLLDLQLDAQRRLADAESLYYRSLAEHAVAIKNVHLEKGSLLDYNNVFLSEGPWPRKAYRDALRHIRLSHESNALRNYVCERAVSRGPYPQHLEPWQTAALPAESITPPEPTPTPAIRRLPAVPESRRLPEPQAGGPSS